MIGRICGRKRSRAALLPYLAAGVALMLAGAGVLVYAVRGLMQ